MIRYLTDMPANRLAELLQRLAAVGEPVKLSCPKCGRACWEVIGLAEDRQTEDYSAVCEKCYLEEEP